MIEPWDKGLLATTLHYPYEIRDDKPYFEDIPDLTLPDEMKQFAGQFERDNFRFAETNRRIGTATREMFASWMPHLLTPFVRWGVYSLLDDSMLESFGFPRPFPFVRKLVHGALKTRAWIVRLLPARRTPNFFCDRRNRTYPRGYELAKLGPPKVD